MLLLLQMMFNFKVPAISTNSGSQTSTPLIHCRTDDVVIQVAPLRYHSLHQVVDVTSIRIVLKNGNVRPSFTKSNISAKDRILL